MELTLFVRAQVKVCLQRDGKAIGEGHHVFFIGLWAANGGLTVLLLIVLGAGIRMKAASNGISQVVIVDGT